jgi:hypothetical protein
MISKGDVLLIRRAGHNTIQVELSEDQASPTSVCGRRLHWETGRPIGNGEPKRYPVDGDCLVLKPGPAEPPGLRRPARGPQGVRGHVPASAVRPRAR